MRDELGRFVKGHSSSPATQFKKGDKTNLGRKHSPETIEKLKQAKLGRKYTIEHRRKMSEAHKGDRCTFWKGGVTPVNKAIRKSFGAKLWREAVFERDDYTCQMCDKRGVYLQADHIKPFAFFPELRFDLDNGRTLCRECHMTTDTYMGRATANYGK